MSHERLDIQHCVKTLAGSMRTPTKQSEKCLIQLCLYLKGTANLSFRLPYTPIGTRMSGKLNNRPEHEVEDNIHVMEAFCDSDWACGAQRKSTTSVIVLLNGLVALSYGRTQKAVASSSCEAEVLALTGASEAILLKEVWSFLINGEILLEARSDSSSGRQWLQRSGLGRLKHTDVRLCWLQMAIREKVLKVLPVSTQVNIADLNAKKLTAARRHFLLSFIGAVRLNDENEVVEEVGESEQLNYFAEQQWKQQVRQVSKWMKSPTSKAFVHCALLAQAFNMKGCAEKEEELVNTEQSHFWMTVAIFIVLGCCNWLYQHWEQVVARAGRRGH